MKKYKDAKANHWLSIIEAWKKSGLTKKHFCQQNNINNKTFYRWHTKLRYSQLTAEGLTQSTLPTFKDFIPVVMNEANKKPSMPEQHCTLLLNTKLKLQIPIAVIDAQFLQILMVASRTNLC